jgi:hypothetical protein
MDDPRRRIAELQRNATSTSVPALDPSLTTRAIDLLKDFQECMAARQNLPCSDANFDPMMELKKDMDILSSRISTLYSSVHNSVAAKQENVESQLVELKEARAAFETGFGQELQDLWGYIRDDSDESHAQTLPVVSEAAMHLENGHQELLTRVGRLEREMRG